MSYQIQAKVIAVIEMVLSTILMVMIASTYYYTFTEDYTGELEDQPKPIDDPCNERAVKKALATRIREMVMTSMYTLTEFVLGLFLYRSADKKQYKRLRIWLTISATLTFVGAALIIPQLVIPLLIASMSIPNTIPMILLFFILINFIFTCYSLWVVYALISEIKSHANHHPVLFGQHNAESGGEIV